MTKIKTKVERARERIERSERKSTATRKRVTKRAAKAATPTPSPAPCCQGAPNEVPQGLAEKSPGLPGFDTFLAERYATGLSMDLRGALQACWGAATAFASGALGR